MIHDRRVRHVCRMRSARRIAVISSRHRVSTVVRSWRRHVACSRRLRIGCSRRRSSVRGRGGSSGGARDALYAKRIASSLAVDLVATTAAAAGQATGSIEGVVTDSSGARLPGVTVESDRPANGSATPVATSVTDGDGTYRAAADQARRLSSSGSRWPASHVRKSARRCAWRDDLVPVTLQVNGLAETVNVVANSIALDVSTSTQTTSFSSETLTELPTASRNYTHVIVGGSRRQRAAARSHRPRPQHRDQPRHAGRGLVAVAQPERQRRAADQQRPAHQRHRRHQHAQRERRTRQQHQHPARRARGSGGADFAAFGVTRPERRRQRRADHARRARIASRDRPATTSSTSGSTRTSSS